MKRKLDGVEIAMTSLVTGAVEGNSIAPPLDAMESVEILVPIFPLNGYGFASLSPSSDMPPSRCELIPRLDC